MNFLRFLVLTTLFSLISLSAHSRVLEKVYAVVNGEIITLTEIKDYQEKLQHGGFLNDLLFSNPEVRQKAIKDKDYLLKLLVDEKIIDYEVKQNGFLVTQERVDKEISTIAKRQNMSVAQLRQTIKSEGVNFSEYQDFVKKSIERRQLVEKEITSKIKISDQDIVSYYMAKNKSTSSQIYSFNLSHILLPKSKKDLAKDLSNKLKQGASFTDLVKEHSVDSDSKNKAGSFGQFKSGEMIASIEKAITNLEIGDTSPVVETPMGLHIFKVTDKKLINDPRIEQAKQEIYQSLFAEAFQEQLDFWLLQKRKDAIIQINKS